MYLTSSLAAAACRSAFSQYLMSAKIDTVNRVSTARFACVPSRGGPALRVCAVHTHDQNLCDVHQFAMLYFLVAVASAAPKVPLIFLTEAG